jgi:hypothetical protein
VYATNVPLNYTDPTGLGPVRAVLYYEPSPMPWGVPYNVLAGNSGMGRGASSGTSVAQCFGGLFLSTGGTASSLKAAEHIRGSGASLEWYSRAQGKWYAAERFLGNQYTERGKLVIAAGKQARVAGVVFGGAGIALGVGQAGYAANNDDWTAAGWHLVDAGFAAVGTFGGPPGLAVSLAYFGAAFYAGC